MQQGAPDSHPSRSQLTVFNTPVQPSKKKPQEKPDSKSTSDQHQPANSTSTADLGLHDANNRKLKPGAMLITQEGEYLTLGKHTFSGWNVINIYTKEEKNIENENKMAEWRYIGKLSGHYEEENNSMDHADQLDFVRKKDYDKKLFVTAQINYHKETYSWSTSPNQSTITRPVQMQNKKN